MYWKLFTIGITLVYIALILYYRYHWLKIRLYPAVLNTDATLPFISIIVVGRNEAPNISTCLSGIYENDYPGQLFEVIYVDDHSEDDSLKELTAFKDRGLCILALANYPELKPKGNYKKQGVEFALKHARGEMILHTDADTIVGKNWIRSHVSGYLTGFEFTAAPVFFSSPTGFLSHFQCFDLTSTMGVTGAGIRSGLHYLANGANMSYSMTTRNGIGNIQGEDFDSGDDVFLVQDIGLRRPGSVGFIAEPEATVHTKPEEKWTDFFKQRFRWAGKSGAYKDKKLLVVEFLVFFTNLNLVINGLITLLYPGFLAIFLFTLLTKLLVDALFIGAVEKRLHLTLNWFYFFPSFLFFPIYYLIVGTSVFLPVKKQWKGREIR